MQCSDANVQMLEEQMKCFIIYFRALLHGVLF